MTTVAGRPPRTVHVEHCMGTVFSFDLRDPGDWSKALGEAIDWLHRVDRLFSTYRDDSDVSRLARGEIDFVDADPLVTDVLELCDHYEQLTEGFFTAAWTGGFDPTGLVKGWAVEQASEILGRHGCQNHAVNGGGDVQTSGSPEPGRSWRIGVVDPRDRTTTLGAVAGSDLAVATSGTAERGEHIVDPTTGSYARELHSVTVVGASLTTVDVLATTTFARGRDGLEWLKGLPAVSALAVTADGEVVRVGAGTETAVFGRTGDPL